MAPLQVHYYSEALPTQHGYCVGDLRRIAHATASEGLVMLSVRDTITMQVVHVYSLYNPAIEVLL